MHCKFKCITVALDRTQHGIETLVYDVASNTFITMALFNIFDATSYYSLYDAKTHAS